MRGQKNPVKTTLTLLLTVLLASAAAASEIEQSLFDQELNKLRYSYNSGGMQDRYDYAATVDEADLPLDEIARRDGTPRNYKSPGKAFLFSLAVPGLGQWYSGGGTLSKVKAALFVGVEAFGWSQALKFHGNGSDLTDEYEAFNRTHWMRDRYEQYLTLVYETTAPHELDPRPEEITHVLPDGETQQYFEMTGKYAQFAWGWDDAILDDRDWNQTLDALGIPDTINTDATTPQSANREKYENMRNAANDEFSKSTKFVFVIMANHLVSAFEAYFTTKGRNNKLRYEQEFARIKFRPSLRSYHTFKDTPYLTVTYKF